MKFYIRALIIVFLTSVTCSYFGQVLLFLIEYGKNYYQYLIYLTPVVLIFTKHSNRYFKTGDIGMKYLITGIQTNTKKISWYFPILLVINTFFAHLTGVSVGREGVAVQLGGTIGKNFADEKFSADQYSYLIRLGMICGFSVLFQTPLAALFFILEITRKKIKITRVFLCELVSYVVFSFTATKVSDLLGLEKFFVFADFSFKNITLEMYLKIVMASICFILVGMLFVIIQKFLKKITGISKIITWILIGLFIIISFITQFRYTSLGTNLINFSFFDTDQITRYDFILKLLLTVICTAVGFSGGEVTPLFAIGASLGVVLSETLGLPIYILAGIGYSLVFSSATKSFLTPILLVLEVFGIKLMFLASFPALIIYFINRKYSIYE